MPQSDPESKSSSMTPLAGAGGIVVAAQNSREPYEALDDLMSVVEAFSPRWPPRGTFRSTGRFLL